MPKQLSIVVYFLCFVCYRTLAQQPAADTASTQEGPLARAIQVFHQATGLQSQLYNGRTHIPYAPNMLGSAYYLSNDPQTGMVEYDHIVFKNVLLRYDEVRDKVVVQHFNTVSAFELFDERVSRFSLGDHPFIRLVQEAENTDNTPATGFYEILQSSRLTILARRKKLVTEFIENMEVKKRIDNKESYYARIAGVYYSVNNQRSLLGIMKDKKGEVQQYMKKNGWKFKKDPDNYLAKAAAYYNQIIR